MEGYCSKEEKSSGRHTEVPMDDWAPEITALVRLATLTEDECLQGLTGR